MSEIRVIKKKSPVSREPAPGPVSELFTSAIPFVTIPFTLVRGGMGAMSRVMGAAAGLETESRTPAIDVDRSDGVLVVTAEAPGFRKNEVKVELTGQELVIAGERKLAHTDDRREFHQSITLPEGAKVDHIKAELNNGVLKVSIPVVELKKKIRPMSAHKKITHKKTKRTAA